MKTRVKALTRYVVLSVYESVLSYLYESVVVIVRAVSELVSVLIIVDVGCLLIVCFSVCPVDIFAG